MWLAICVFALILIASVLYTKVFSGRGAFIHVGALVGTIMAVNVFGVIIPGQKKMIAQMIAGQSPDPRYGAVGKQRSTHNNYLTLPVLLMMVSQHYPFLFSHPQSWLIVALIIISGALIRHALNRVDAGDDWNSYGWTLPVAAMALIATIYVTRAAIAHGQHGRRRGDRCGRAEHRHQALPHVPRARTRRIRPSRSRPRTWRWKASPRCAATPSKSICRPCKIGPCRWATRPA